MPNKKKLLIYAHYYVPDIASTGQLLRELAEGMLAVYDVTVICVVPSYLGIIEDVYKTKKLYEENRNGVKVLRIRVPEFNKENKVSRIKNILAYFFGAMAATFKVGRMDYVYSISQPPILGGLLGVWGKWLKRARYIYIIQDFNPEQVMTIGYSKSKAVLKVMMLLDKISCHCADKVIVVGRDMEETLIKRFKGKKVPHHAFINNWIDEKEIYPLPANNEGVLAFRKRFGLDGKFVIMYSGNIGLYYDLEKLLTVIYKMTSYKNDNNDVHKRLYASDGREVVFAFVGAGCVLDKLVLYKERHHMDSVEFIPYQDKADLIYSLNAADVHWCVNARGIRGVSVPSKCYGIMAAGRPILGVLEEGAEARLLIEDTGCGICCEPGDYGGIERGIQWFVEKAGSNKIREMGMKGRKYLVKNLTKDVSVRKYMDNI